MKCYQIIYLRDGKAAHVYNLPTIDHARLEEARLRAEGHIKGEARIYLVEWVESVY